MRKTKFVDDVALFSVPVPTHGGKYAPIPHKDIVNEVKAALAKENIEISQSIYKSTGDGQVALGQHLLKSTDDPDIQMMFAWVNSYNKQRKFSSGVGAYVTVCLNGMLSAKYGEYSRKHLGNAHAEAMASIAEQVGDARKIFQELITNKNQMIETQLTETLRNQIIGKVFMENVLGNYQLTTVKNELTNPTYQYSGDTNSAWHLYNHMTHALKDTSPVSFTDKHVELNRIFSDCINDQAVITETPILTTAKIIDEVKTEETVVTQTAEPKQVNDLFDLL